MAKATLPTNFQDDILSANMNNKRRYRVIQNSDGTISLEDVSIYTQVGSNFGAAQMNSTNKAVNESVDKAVIIDNYNDLIANTTSGKIVGALAAKNGFNELNRNKVKKWEKTYNFANISSHGLNYIDIQADLATLVGNDQTKIISIRLSSSAGGVIPYLYHTSPSLQVSYLYLYNVSASSIASGTVKMSVSYIDG